MDLQFRVGCLHLNSLVISVSLHVDMCCFTIIYNLGVELKLGFKKLLEVCKYLISIKLGVDTCAPRKNDMMKMGVLWCVVDSSIFFFTSSFCFTFSLASFEHYSIQKQSMGFMLHE